MNTLKKLLRPVYYYFNHGKIVKLQGYPHLKDSLWVLDKRFGKAYYSGNYEKEVCLYLLNNISQEDVFIDVGSHAGYFSLFASKLCTKGIVYSFEPDIENYNFSKRIKELNKANNWELFNKGVGAKLGKLFYSKGITSSTGKIQDHGDIEIRITTLDNDLREEKKISLIKIDVEGFGHNVIDGSRNIIQKHFPKILMEIHNNEELLSANSLINYGYKLYDFKTKKLLMEGNNPSFIIAEKQNPSL